MPEIREPYPINPVWPTKPDKEKGGRKRTGPPEKQKERPRKDSGQTGDDRPQIDEYA